MSSSVDMYNEMAELLRTGKRLGIVKRIKISCAVQKKDTSGLCIDKRGCGEEETERPNERN